MTDKKPSNFKIQIDDETLDSQPREGAEDLRIKMLSQRMTLISILIPCLIGVILFVAYLDIRKRVSNVHSTTVLEVQTFSEDLALKLSSLTIQYAKLEDSLAERISSIERTASSLKIDLKEAEKAISKIGLLKADRKELTDALAKTDKALLPIRKDLKNIVSEIKALDKKFNKELANLFETADKAKIELNRLQADITTISSDKIDRKALDLALKDKEKVYQQQIDLMAENLEDRIESIQKRIREFEEAVSPGETVILKPGTIIEKDIR